MTIAFDASLLPERAGKRIALVGLGNELNGDDAAGVLVVREIKERLSTTGGGADSSASACLLIEGGTAPENYTGPLRRFQPDWVIMIDAAHLEEAPGSLAWIAWEEIGGMSASTHTLPPSMLARYLMQELGCRVALIGIQPEHLEFDEPVSAPVAEAVKNLAQELAGWCRGDPARL